MNIESIKNEKDYAQTLAKLVVIFDAKKGGAEGTELEILGELIDDYENVNFPYLEESSEKKIRMKFYKKYLLKMKYLYILFILFPTISFSQTDLKVLKIDTARNITQGSNVIYVHNADFMKVCNAVLDAGFKIDKKDNDLKTLETEELQNDVWIPVISIRIRDSITIIKTKIYSHILNIQQTGTYHQNKKGRPNQDAIAHAFLLGYKVAQLIGGEIECKKE